MGIISSPADLVKVIGSFLENFAGFIISAGSLSSAFFDSVTGFFSSRIFKISSLVILPSIPVPLILSRSV